MIRAAKKAYFDRKLEETSSNPKKMWDVLLNDIVRNPTNKKSLPDNFKDEQGIISEPAVIADNFNAYFSTIATKLDAKLPPSPIDPISFLDDINPSEKFTFLPVDARTVEHVILNLNDTAAAGDLLSSKILKLIAPILIRHLVHLFNLCISQGVFPSEFKKAIVVPIYKNGSQFEFSNYRPISLLPVMSKVLEKLVYIQLLDFLLAEGLIYDNQFGFREKHSTYMPMSLLYEQITSAIFEHQSCAAVYLDLSKAFDTVNHQILFRKLKKYGIDDDEHGNCPLKFFESYLHERKQVVKYNSTISSCPVTVPLGVPQGSILGPLLFLLFINDVYRSSGTPKFQIFADDTVLLYKSTDHAQLQSDIEQSLPDITSWLICNRLTINVKKSNYQLFSARKHIPDISINIFGDPIQRKFSVKYLGVLVDEDLRWSSQIRAVENTISRNIGIIRRSAYILSSKHLNLLYNALVLPTLTHCVQIWGSTYHTKFTKIITLQKKMVRIIDHAEFLAHTSPIFKKYNLLKFMDIRIVMQLNVVQQFLCNTLPSPLAVYFVLDPCNHSRAARAARHFSLPNGLTNYRKFSLFYSAPDLWNSHVATKIRNLDDVPRSKVFFKKVIKKMFIDQY